MTKEDAVLYLDAGISLFDTAKRELYIPDITESPFQYHGIQKARIYVNDETLVNSLTESISTITEWALQTIPAPGALSGNEYGRMFFATSIDESQNGDENFVLAHLQDYVGQLEEKSILRSMVMEQTYIDQIKKNYCADKDFSVELCGYDKEKHIFEFGVYQGETVVTTLDVKDGMIHNSLEHSYDELTDATVSEVSKLGYWELCEDYFRSNYEKREGTYVLKDSHYSHQVSSPQKGQNKSR